MPKSISPLVKIFYYLILTFLAGYFFIAFLPFPGGISTGLDPSWQYGISRAAEDKLVFGRDIIFTFGSLGYLVIRSALEANFFSKLAFNIVIHSALFGVAIAKIIHLKNNLQRLSLLISLLLTYNITIVGISQLDYQIIFAFIILLSWDSILNSKYTRLWSLGLGGIAGFCFTTKFTVGICTFGAILLLLLSNLYSSIKLNTNLKTSILSLTDLCIATISVSFVFLNPSPLASFYKLLICVAISATWGIATWLFHRLNRNKTQSDVEKKVPSKAVNRLANTVFGWRGFYWVYCICLLTIVLFSSPSIVDFIKSSLQLSSGYSSAMSIVGSPFELGFAISEVLIVLLLLIPVAREVGLGFPLSIAFLLWMFFKHGFVRQDAHVLLFVFSVPLLVSLCISKVRNIRTIKLAFMVHTYVLTILMVYYLATVPFGNKIPKNTIFQTLNPVVVSNKFSSLFKLDQVREAIKASSQANLSTVKLPEGVINTLKNKKIDILPWEVSMVPANNLNWKPRPIFQSYAAYTSFLDHENTKSMLSEPRDYILYQFVSIDDRHPFFDEPETIFNVFCNYTPSSKFPNFVSTPAFSNLIVLEKRSSSRCSSGSEGKELSIGWNQSIEPSDGVLVRASVKFEYSILGKIYKTLFRSPPVMMNINFIEGFNEELNHSYRIIPENSENKVFISHLPVTDGESLSFFKGDLVRPVSSFSFSTINPILYKSKIKLRFTSYNILGSSTSQQINAARLKSVKFNLTQNDDNIGWIDSKQTIAERGNTINASGWAASRLNSGKEVWVLLTYGANNKILAITKTSLPRPDVASFFKNNDYYYSGWATRFSSSNIEDKIQKVRAWIYEPSTNIAHPINGEYRVEIR